MDKAEQPSSKRPLGSHSVVPAFLGPRQENISIVELRDEVRLAIRKGSRVGESAEKAGRLSSNENTQRQVDIAASDWLKRLEIEVPRINRCGRCGLNEVAHQIRRYPRGGVKLNQGYSLAAAVHKHCICEEST